MSAICCRRLRSSLRREIKPVAVCRGPTYSVPSAATMLAGAGHEAQAPADGFGQRQRLGQRFDDPGLAQQAAGQHGKFRCRLDELVGPAQHARPAVQIDLVEMRFGRHGVEPDEPDPAGQRRRALQLLDQLAAAGHDQAAGQLAQRHFDQRRGFEVDLQQIGHQAANLPKGAAPRPGA